MTQDVIWMRLVSSGRLWQAHAMRSLRSWLPAVVTCATLWLAAASPAVARLARKATYRDKTAGVQISLPEQWMRQTRSAFPGVLVTFKHTQSNARLILAAKRRTLGQTLMHLARANAAVLKARKWSVGPITATRLGRLVAVELVATDPKGTHQVRQVYAVRDRFAYVLSLICPSAHGARLHADLLYVQKSARFAR